MAARRAAHDNRSRKVSVLAGKVLDMLCLKLAVGNVRRAWRDYSVYFATLAFAACLLYSFIASTDYLLALELTDDQRGLLRSASDVMQGFSVFVIVVFVFLSAYANRFIVRRRKREFGLYALLGMRKSAMAAILTVEGVIVGAVSFAAGIVAGTVLSPAFSAVAAFVFGVPWGLAFSFSPAACAWTAGAFAVMTVLGAIACVLDVLRRPLIELMDAVRAPERLRLAGKKATWAQLVLGIMLLSVVYTVCVLYPMYFLVFIIPAGFMALGATVLVMRFMAARWPRVARHRPRRYWKGLHAFTVRQVEARVSSSAAALSCVCVLVAASVCMTCTGFAFSVGMRAPGAEFMHVESLMPIGYVGIFYGLTFLVAAAAVLALQQLSGAADAIRAYRTLSELGCDADMMRATLRSQVRVYFAVPLVFALVHDVFGLFLVVFLAVAMGSGSTALIIACVLTFTLAVMFVYYRLTCRASEHFLFGTATRGEDGR